MIFSMRSAAIPMPFGGDRKSTRLNSSHLVISYAVFCLKKKNHVPMGLPKALSEAEVESLLASPVGEEPTARRDQAVLEVLHGAGLRLPRPAGRVPGGCD